MSHSPTSTPLSHWTSEQGFCDTHKCSNSSINVQDHNVSFLDATRMQNFHQNAVDLDVPIWLHVSQTASTFHESSKHFSSKPDCTNTAELPSFTLRFARSQYHLIRWGVLHNDSNLNLQQSSPTNQGLIVQMIFRMADGSNNFWNLLLFSWEDVVLHGHDRIYWMATKSCATYLWLLRDAHSSLRTSWSAVIKPPNSYAWGAWFPVRFLARSTRDVGPLAHTTITVL